MKKAVLCSILLLTVAFLSCLLITKARDNHLFEAEFAFVLKLSDGTPASRNANSDFATQVTGRSFASNVVARLSNAQTNFEVEDMWFIATNANVEVVSSHGDIETHVRLTAKTAELVEAVASKYIEVMEDMLEDINRARINAATSWFAMVRDKKKARLDTILDSRASYRNQADYDADYESAKAAYDNACRDYETALQDSRKFDDLLFIKHSISIVEVAP